MRLRYTQEYPDIYRPTCTACGHKCTLVLVDHGIGPYEFWGAKGIDVDEQWSSNCCEADVTELADWVRENATTEALPDGTFSAYIEDWYDGAPDSDWGQLGFGNDENEATEDLVDQFDDVKDW